MLDDLKDMFRYAAKDTVSFMADWRRQEIESGE